MAEAPRGVLSKPARIATARRSISDRRDPRAMGFRALRA
jgi:hypothetical protein